MSYLKWLDETGIDEVELVGGKNASLGEMIKNLKTLNIKVPYGFVITAESYDLFMDHNNLNEKINNIINETNIDDFVDLRRNSLKIRNIIIDGEIPEKLKEWFNQHKNNILPTEFNKSIAYDCQSNPFKYIKYSFYMNEQYELFISFRGVFIFPADEKLCLVF